jgi:hypothetical protein
MMTMMIENGCNNGCCPGYDRRYGRCETFVVVVVVVGPFEIANPAIEPPEFDRASIKM